MVARKTTRADLRREARGASAFVGEGVASLSTHGLRGFRQVLQTSLAGGAAARRRRRRCTSVLLHVAGGPAALRLAARRQARDVRNGRASCPTPHVLVFSLIV
jgi:hypothetical protein